MIELDKMIDEMTHDVYERLVSGIELGKWQDGSVLTAPQRESTMQLVILYQARKLNQTAHLTINSEGKLNELTKSELQKQLKGEAIID